MRVHEVLRYIIDLSTIPTRDGLYFTQSIIIIKFNGIPARFSELFHDFFSDRFNEVQNATFVSLVLAIQNMHILLLKNVYILNVRFTIPIDLR